MRSAAAVRVDPCIVLDHTFMYSYVQDRGFDEWRPMGIQQGIPLRVRHPFGRMVRNLHQRRFLCALLQESFAQFVSDKGQNSCRQGAEKRCPDTPIKRADTLFLKHVAHKP